jgi:hypothetical protein
MSRSSRSAWLLCSAALQPQPESYMVAFWQTIVGEAGQCIDDLRRLPRGFTEFGQDGRVQLDEAVP